MKIVDARASENHTKRRMKAYIQGGPLSVLSRDRVYYASSFLYAKCRKDFTWLVDQVKDENDRWIYALRFRTTSTPLEPFRLLYSRKEAQRIGISHYQDKFYLTVADRKHLNGAVYVTDTSRTERKHWEEVLPHREDVMLTGFLIFDNYFVVSETEAAENRVRVIERATGKDHFVKIKKEDLYSVFTGYNPDTDTDTLQYVYTSYQTRPVTVNYHMGTKDTRVVRRNRQFDFSGRIVSKLEWATAPDGTKIPITIVYDKWRGGGRKTDHKRVFLESYGAYGSGSSPGYSNFVTTLTLRGFTYAYAHVRGGDEMGMQWYEGGRLKNKRNTFTDYVACAERLVELGYAEPGTITAQGGSAGGLLMGAVANLRPDLFRAIILDVPFVDVINTMLDDQLPLTTGEYLEWGNPHKKKDFEYMLSYSPYENVRAQDYPHLFFFTGLNDTRVGYWEPAKMVAKLRKLKTNDKLLLLKTNLSAGHGGASGRIAALQEAAYKIALLMDLYAQEEGVK